MEAMKCHPRPVLFAACTHSVVSKLVLDGSSRGWLSAGCSRDEGVNTAAAEAGMLVFSAAPRPRDKLVGAPVLDGEMKEASLFEARLGSAMVDAGAASNAEMV